MSWLYATDQTEGEFTIPDGNDHCCIVNSGTKMYLLNPDYVEEYTLSTAYDPNSATHIRSFTHGISVGGGIAFSDDGLTFQIIKPVLGAIIRQYTVSTAWNISDASFDASISLSAYQSCNGIKWNSDGTKFLTRVAVSSPIYYWKVYSCSTAYDIGTATLSSTSAGTSSRHLVPNAAAFYWSSDGKYIYYQASEEGYHRTITLETAWDVSSTLTCNYSVYIPNFTDGGTIKAQDFYLDYDTGYFYVLLGNSLSLDIYRCVFFEKPLDFGDIQLIFAANGRHAALSELDLGIPIVKADDVIYFFGRKDDDAGGNWAASGFTHLSTQATSSGNDQSSGILRRVVASDTSNGATETIGTTDVDAISACIMIFRGVDPDDPEDVTIQHLSADNSYTPTISGVTTVTDGCLLLTGISSDGSGVSLTRPSGYTEIATADEVSGATMAVAAKSQTTKGATGSIVWANSNDSAENHIFVVALRPGATALTHYSVTAGYGDAVISGEVSKLAYSTSEDIRDENQLGINDVDYWNVGDALITDQQSDYLELEVP